jgi:hypothetical protein
VWVVQKKNQEQLGECELCEMEMVHFLLNVPTIIGIRSLFVERFGDKNPTQENLRIRKI